MLCTVWWKQLDVDIKPYIVIMKKRRAVINGRKMIFRFSLITTKLLYHPEISFEKKSDKILF